MTEYRTEKDSLGEMQVPADALWGASTQRAVENFPISDLRFPRRFIAALGVIKKAAADVNAELGVIDAKLRDAIVAAADEVIAGDLDQHFVLDIFQTGSGTSTNMNANEVIAQRAAQIGGLKVHPNDHVNAGQSSNDVIPTAMQVAACIAIAEDLLPALDRLEFSLRAKAVEFDDVVKSGRTHLMDATPVRLGQEFGGYASQIEHSRARIEAGVADLVGLPLGGTAVGTGINTPAEFPGRTIARVSALTGIEFREAKDHFERQSTRDVIVYAHGTLNTLAVSLCKIANDLRLMGSGPRAGLAEIFLPELQKGSSIMPGKVNPVIPEVVTQVAAQVIGNDAAITVGGLQGHFELNVFIPLMARNLLDSIRLLASASRLLAEKCVDGIEANREQCERYAELTLSAAAALNPHIGYDKASEIVKEASSSGRSLREVARDAGVDESVLDEALDYRALAQPHG